MTSSKSFFTVVALIAVLAWPASALAAVDAEAVVQGKCTACHSPERIREASKSEAEWAELIDKEVDRGAQLSRAEKKAVVAWLTQNYGDSQVAQAEAPAAQPVQTQAPVAVAQTSESLPFTEQAKTGVELWQFILSGGALFSSGAYLRRRK